MCERHGLKSKPVHELTETSRRKKMEELAAILC
jgi:hypothetical protein